MTARDRKAGVAALFLAAALFGGFGPLIRQMAEMFGDAAQVTVRLTIAFLVASAFVMIRRKPISLPRSAHPRLLGLGIAQAGIYTFFTLSVTQTKIANTTFLLFAGVIFMSTLLGRLLFGERLTPVAALALALAMCGLAVYNGPTLDISAATAFGLLAGFCVGFTGTFRKLLMNEDRALIVWASLGYAMLASIPMNLVTDGEIIRTTSLMSIVATVVFGVLVVTQSNLVTFGYSHVNLGAGGVILSTEVAFGGLFGWIGYNEVPTAPEFSGALLIICGAVLLAIRQASSRETVPAVA
jgi:drug/metabolite transporter (DMT)-like permease